MVDEGRKQTNKAVILHEYMLDLEGAKKPERQTKTDTRTMSGKGSRGKRLAVSEGAVSTHGAQSECRAMESASQDWDFDQRASDCASPIARWDG